MIKQYPHTMSYETAGTNASKDEYGNWQPGTPGATATQDCRATTNGGGRQITLADGKAYQYAYKVYLPVAAASMKPGQEVNITITDTGEQKAKGIIKEFARNQMHCILWL